MKKSSTIRKRRRSLNLGIWDHRIPGVQQRFDLFREWHVPYMDAANEASEEIATVEKARLRGFITIIRKMARGLYSVPKEELPEDLAANATYLEKKYAILEDWIESSDFCIEELAEVWRVGILHAEFVVLYTEWKEGRTKATDARRPRTIEVERALMVALDEGRPDPWSSVDKKIRDNISGDNERRILRKCRYVYYRNACRTAISSWEKTPSENRAGDWRSLIPAKAGAGIQLRKREKLAAECEDEAGYRSAK